MAEVTGAMYNCAAMNVDGGERSVTRAESASAGSSKDEPASGASSSNDGGASRAGSSNDGGASRAGSSNEEPAATASGAGDEAAGTHGAAGADGAADAGGGADAGEASGAAQHPEAAQARHSEAGQLEVEGADETTHTDAAGPGRSRSWHRRLLLSEEIAEARRRAQAVGAPEVQTAVANARQFERALAELARPEEEIPVAPALRLAQDGLAWALVAHTKLEQPAVEVRVGQRERLLGPLTAITDRGTMLDARLAFLRDEEQLAALNRAQGQQELALLRRTLRDALDHLEAEALVSRLQSVAALRVLALTALILAMLVGGYLAGQRALRGENLARAAEVTASSRSTWVRNPQSLVDGDRKRLGVHTKKEKRPWVKLDLGEPRDLRQVRVVNRTDCCQKRALPLLLELSSDGKAWRRAGRREKVFTTWSASVTARARYLRLTVDQPSPTILHLSEVEAYGP